MSILVIDLGGTGIKYGVFDKRSGLQLSKRDNLPITYSMFLDKLLELSLEYRNYNIRGISLSLPGPVNNETGIVTNNSAVPYIHNIPIKKDIENKLNLPVVIENDANCSLIAEHQIGVAKEYKSVIGLVIGSGVGGAIIYDNKLIKSNYRYAGEFGMMLIGEKPVSYYTLKNSCERYNIKYNTNYTGYDLFHMALDDCEISLIIEEMYTNIAKCIFNLIYSFEPEIIVIGGAISANNKFIDELNKRVMFLQDEMLLKEFRIPIRAAQYKNDANLIGAGLNYYYKNKEEEK